MSKNQSIAAPVLAPIPKQCLTCAYFDRIHDRPATGHCKRYAPAPYVVTHGQNDYDKTLPAYWPLVAEQEWCGEWAEKR